MKVDLPQPEGQMMAVTAPIETSAARREAPNWRTG
jgi:hypothetical protein